MRTDFKNSTWPFESAHTIFSAVVHDIDALDISEEQLIEDWGIFTTTQPCFTDDYRTFIYNHKIHILNNNTGYYCFGHLLKAGWFKGAINDIHVTYEIIMPKTPKYKINYIATEDELAHHMEEIKKFHDLQWSFRTTETSYVLTVDITATPIWHKFLLTFIRHIYESPFQCATDLVMSMQKDKTLSKVSYFNLYHFVMAAIFYCDGNSEDDFSGYWCHELSMPMYPDGYIINALNKNTSYAMYEALPQWTVNDMHDCCDCIPDDERIISVDVYFCQKQRLLEKYIPEAIKFFSNYTCLLKKSL